MNVIVMLDIGKTNKKCFVLDAAYRIVFEKTATLPETTDDDGDRCEDLFLLKNWISAAVREVLDDPRFEIRAMNCTTYGASFVHLDAAGEPLTPLYNYLKPFPGDLAEQFFAAHGGVEKLALETASPALGMLNSGLQLYWLKHRKPLIFNRIKWSLHLPQWVAMCMEHTKFVNFLKVDKSPPNAPPAVPPTEMTSLGCHTMLWDFRKNDYHDWVKSEGIAEKLPPVSAEKIGLEIPRGFSEALFCGGGLHDSSAALLPYLATFREPFVLISTGTWCISLNPFNNEPLTAAELQNDCLCYLTAEGKPVKAARYFGGNEHEQAVKKLAAAFGTVEIFYQKDLSGEPEILEAYAALMRQLVEKQAVSTRLALGKSPVRRIFVDGGFSKNELFMTFLAEAFPEMEVFAAEIPQATALGAALAIHPLWNSGPMPENLISLKKHAL